MRTKTLLLTATLGLVGVAGVSAQSVYSVNAVGYVNLQLVSGYNLICNPLNGTNNNLNTVIPVALGDSIAFRWNPGSQSFLQADTYFDVGDPLLNGWYDGGGNKTSTAVNPGEGFFVQSPSTTTLTFVGEVPQGNLTNSIPSNFSFKSSIVPQSVGITTIGFPGVNDMLYQAWNPAGQGYAQALTYFDVGDPLLNGFYTGGGDKVDPTPAVGQGFLIFNPGVTLNWGRSFSVN